MLNVTKNPMTLDYAVQLMKANGCVVVCSEERRTIVTDPNGNEFLLTDDPQCYARFGASFAVSALMFQLLPGRACTTVWLLLRTNALYSEA